MCTTQFEAYFLPMSRTWKLTISKSRRTSFSDSPLYLEVSVDEDTLKKVVLHSVATALASSVLPVPGGPTMRTPCTEKRVRGRQSRKEEAAAFQQHLPGSPDAFEEGWHPHGQHHRFFQQLFGVLQVCNVVPEEHKGKSVGQRERGLHQHRGQACRSAATPVSAAASSFTGEGTPTISRWDSEI